MTGQRVGRAEAPYRVVNMHCHSRRRNNKNQQIQGSELTSHHGHNRINGDIGGLGQAHAAHMEVDGHLELAPDAVVFSPCWVLSDDALQSCPD